MPVVVTGASGFVASSLIPALRARGSEVRATVRRREVADAVRALGAKVAVGSLLDPDVLAPVMLDAHTVCHLAGGCLDVPGGAYEDEIAGVARAVVAAAVAAGIRRFLFLSYPGASPDAANPYLRANGLAEAEIRESGLDHVIVRSTHVYGPGSTWLAEMTRAARRAIATVVGPGTQRVAPVFVRDVVEVLVAGDDRATPVSGTFGLEGPDVVTADELVDLLAGRRRRKVHLSVSAAARTTRWVGTALPAAALEILAADSLADAPDAAGEFGVRRTSLAEGLRASSAAGGHADPTADMVT